MKFDFSFVRAVIFSTLASGLALGCSSRPVVTAVQAPVASQSPGAPRVVIPTAMPIELVVSGQKLIAKPLTSSGENSAPRFSDDGSKMLFLSKTRPSHRHAQVYEIDMIAMTERRLTFHDTEDRTPTWLNSERFLYSSPTDEVKTTDRAFSRLRDFANGTPKNETSDIGDLYSQRFDGRAIDRLTTQSGLEAEAAKGPGNRLVITVTKDNKSTLQDLQNGKLKKLNGTKDGDRNARFSSDSKEFSWLRGDSLVTTPVAKNLDLGVAKSVSTDKEKVKDYDWHPSRKAVVYLLNTGREKTAVIYRDLDKGCVTTLTEVEVDLKDVRFHPDGKRMVFSAQTRGASQIYVTELDPGVLECKPAAP